MARNIGMYYYKEYWKGCDEANHITDNKNEVLYNAKLPSTIPDQIGNTHFELMTTYPGLLIGSGYMHEGWKKDENALKLGFYFDYTSGVPCIPGSSIKGVINEAVEHWDYVRSICTQSISNNLNNITKEQFRKRIFGGQKKQQSLYSSIIFHEAMATSVDRDGLLGDDYITPHKNKEGNKALDVFSNPNPIHFLKVMPGVTFRFDFFIPDQVTIGENVFSKLGIESIFRSIILDFGLGVKTNVGYGYFIEDPELLRKRENKQKEEQELEEKRKEKEEVEQRLQALKDKEEERKGIEVERKLQKKEDKAKLIIEGKEKGIVAYLKMSMTWKLAKEAIDDYKNDLEIASSDVPNIKVYLDSIIEGELLGKDSRDWKKAGKKNWYKIESWVGKDTVQLWFEEFIK